jgi:hypothetical protein
MKAIVIGAMLAQATTTLTPRRRHGGELRAGRPSTLGPHVTYLERGIAASPGPAYVSICSSGPRWLPVGPRRRQREMPHLKYNVDARKSLVDYVSQVFDLRRHTGDLTAGTREAIIQSQVLIARVDANLTMKAPPGWLCPGY